MFLKIFSVRDSAADAFLQPFFAPTTGLAIRSFQDAVNDVSHQFNKHSLDYHLYLLGDFDDATGNLLVQPEPVKIGSAFEYLIKDVTPKNL